MKLSPLSFNLNNQIRNNKIQNQPRLKPMASDSISFSAKIPENIQAELKYKTLRECKDGYGNNIAVSQDSKVLELLQQLKDDTSVSPEFKARILLQNPDDSIGNPLYERIDRSKMGNITGMYDYKVAKALIEAAPDVETTKKQLLTPETRIPLFNADKNGARLLLGASPDDETLRAQIFAKDSRGLRAFWLADKETQEVILSYCDKETRRELLANPKDVIRVFHENKLEQLLALAEDEETKLLMLQASEHGENLLHKSSADNVYYFAQELEEHPEVLKKLLLQKDCLGRIPMSYCHGKLAKAAVLFEISPDDETKKAQLLAKPGYSGENLAYLAMVSEDRRDNPLKNYLYYLMASPDDETLIGQLNARTDYNKTPLKSKLIYRDYVKILEKLENIETKKQLLLGTWVQEKESGGRKIEVECSIDGKLKKPNGVGSGLLIESFGNSLLEIIADDSTTEEEALELIGRYKDLTSSATKEYLTQLEKYFTEQVDK